MPRSLPLQDREVRQGMQAPGMNKSPPQASGNRRLGQRRQSKQSGFSLFLAQLSPMQEPMWGASGWDILAARAQLGTPSPRLRSAAQRPFPPSHLSLQRAPQGQRSRSSEPPAHTCPGSHQGWWMSWDPPSAGQDLLLLYWR